MTRTTLRPGGPPSRFRTLTRVAVGALLLLSLSGCGAVQGAGAEPSAPKTIAAGSAEVKLDVDGAERTFLVGAPERKSNEKLPVIVALHGFEGNAWNFAEWTGFGDLVSEDRFIAIYPDGSPINAEGEQLGWNAGNCCGPPQTEDADDIGFLSRVLDAAPKYGGDPDRIYVVGFSNGGMMTYRAACDLGDRIAGIAVVSGAYNVASCASTNPMPVIIVHGTADEIVPYNGGPPVPVAGKDYSNVSSVSVEDSVRAWLTRDQCDESAVETTPLTESVTERHFTQCAGGYVDLYSYEGLTHTWPTKETQLDATALIVAKFIGA